MVQVGQKLDKISLQELLFTIEVLWESTDKEVSIE